MGASKEFLDVYGIKDIREILGKTDEEIGWHIDEEPYKLDELSVLQGNYVINSIGKCIIRGESRTISASIEVCGHCEIEPIQVHFLR